MAGRTLDIQMLTDQCVTGLGAVIKFNVTPFGRKVTRLTLPIECTLVFIVICVAIETERWRFAMFCADVMAILTGSLLVRACQDKISQLMIEQLRIELDNIRVTPHMFGMACSALLYIGISITAVVSDFVPHIMGNIFMTGFAQGPLLFT
jgi:hypothetical protein